MLRFYLVNINLFVMSKEIFLVFNEKLIFSPDYAVGIVMRIESSIKQAFFRLRHSCHYGEREKVAKGSVLKGGQLVIDSLLYNLGLIYCLFFAIRAIAQYDSGADALYKSGIIKYDMKNYQGAIADYDKSISVNPNYVKVFQTYFNRGMAKLKLNDFKGAIADFSWSIKMHANNAKAYTMRGLAKAKLKDNIDALTDFTKAIQLAPAFEVAYYNRGLTELSMQKYQAAIDDFTKAIQIDANFAEAYNNRGIAYYKTNQKEKARADIEKAKRLKKN
jgi:tetratricopeptide (TPR) repeat protein